VGFEVYEGSTMEVSSMSFLCNYVMTSVGTYHQRSREIQLQRKMSTKMVKIEHSYTTIV
jgi:hypothetical protein